MTLVVGDDEFIIERLNPGVHDRKRFSSGIEALDRYFERQAQQDVDRSAAVVYVLGLSADPTEVAGYYTLSATSISLTSIPDPKKFPRYPNLPGVLIGRLALDTRYRGRGLGDHLLLDALARAEQASHSIGASVVVVDAKDAAAAAFYRHYSFISCIDDPHRLYLPMATIARLNLKPAPLSTFTRRQHRAR